MRFVLSTIGTSSLTNQINNDDPSGWRRLLRNSANRKMDELDSETKTVIDTLADRAFEQLLEDDVQINRRISAELNGIYGIYNGRLPQNSPDQHYLICTDTAQGQKTGNKRTGHRHHFMNCSRVGGLVLKSQSNTGHGTSFPSDLHSRIHRRTQYILCNRRSRQASKDLSPCSRSDKRAASLERSKSS